MNNRSVGGPALKVLFSQGVTNISKSFLPSDETNLSQTKMDVVFAFPLLDLALENI